MAGPLCITQLVKDLGSSLSHKDPKEYIAIKSKMFEELFKDTYSRW